MPSGVVRLRNARKASKSMPREFHSLTDISGLRGTGTRPVAVNIKTGSGQIGSAPDVSRIRPFAKYPNTKAPKSAESSVDGNGEGPIRGHQADKKTK